MKEKARQATLGARDRLIAAAGEIFGEKGFQGATAREITQQASVNLAAINYYFRDKEELYWEVLRLAVHATLRDDQPIDETLPPEEQLSAFVCGILRNLLDPRRPGWHARLISRELSSPTRLLDVLVESGIRPKADLLRKIICRIAGGKLSREQESLLSASVMGQCLYYRQYGPIAERLYPELFQDGDYLSRLERHITEVTLASIRTFSEPARKRKNRPVVPI